VSVPNPEARERERLRRAARGGVCSICGRTSHDDAEPQIRSWARTAERYRQERDEAHAALRAATMKLQRIDAAVYPAPVEVSE
jgi:hypothetical protein